jgi:O-methyltransferase domain
MRNSVVSSPETNSAGLQRAEPLAVPPAQSNTEAVEAVSDLIAVNYVSHCAFELAEVGVADVLGEEPQTAIELARKVGADSNALYRMLRLVATYGVFSEGPDRRFSHSPMSRVLRSDHPLSLRDTFRIGATGVYLRILGGLGHTLRTGRPAAEIAFPEGVFKYFAENPNEAATYDRGMVSASRAEIAAVLRAYDFSRFEAIADIGGGRGHLLEAVLNQALHASGVLFDLPHVVSAIAGQIGQRITVRSGDFFKDPIPACDAYLLKHVLHDWSDEESIKILTSVRRAAPSRATLLVIEAELPDEPGRHPANWLDVAMLCWTSGHERTASEYAQLFAAADFKLARVIRASREVSIFEGSPNA